MQPFFGRSAEIEQFKAELRNPRGAAVLVVGQQGMGKTMLLDRFIAVAGSINGLQCGAVREEVTKSQTVDSVLAILMDRVYEAASLAEGSFESTAHRLKQWRALLNVINIGDLVESLRRDPRRNAREQFLAAIDRIAARMPASHRAVFIIDPEKYLPKDSDEDWAIVIRRLPEKIKLIVAQRPDDALADSDVIGQLSNIARIPNEKLDVLDECGYEELVNQRAPETGITATELRKLLAPYHHHPYAVTAAVNLLAAGVPADELPAQPEPTDFAAAQWKKIQRGGQSESHGDRAVELFRAYALLEVPVPDVVVEAVSGLSSARRTALTADRYLGPLLRDQDGLRRTYHAILSDHIRADVSEADAGKYHRRAITIYRERLNATPPDGLAATRLAQHVRAVEGERAFIACVINECTPRLENLGFVEVLQALATSALAAVEMLPSTLAKIEAEGTLYVILARLMAERGNLDAAEATYRRALAIIETRGLHRLTAATYGSLGIVVRTRGDLDAAEVIHQKALEMFQKLGSKECTANEHGNLGLVMSERGDLEGAETAYTHALELFKDLEDEQGTCRVYGDLGAIKRRRGDLKSAEELHRLSLAIAENLGWASQVARQYAGLGTIAREREDLSGAEVMFRKSLEIYERLGSLSGIANSLSSLGVIMEIRGDLAEAEQAHRKALALNEKMNRLPDVARNHGDLGIVMRARGDLDSAEAMFRKSLTMNENLGRIQGIAVNYANLGILAAQRGDVPGARELWKKSGDLYAKIDAKLMVEKVQAWLDARPAEQPSNRDGSERHDDGKGNAK